VIISRRNRIGFSFNTAEPGHYISEKFHVKNLNVIQNCRACCKLTTQHCKTNGI